MSSLESIEDNSEENIIREKKKKKLASQMIFIGLVAYGIMGTSSLIYFSLGKDQIKGVFTLHEDVIFALNMSFNIFIYAMPAFISAILGSTTRILLSTTDEILNHSRIIFGSGLIGILTFLGLKSGIVFDLLVETVPNVKILSEVEEKKSFYKLILLCFITGMFATTIFLTIEERVTNLANKIKHS